jgi:sterol desaturase/sphingolipid hydroxylase (fatty acid hydroxylase superfamily)
VVVFEGLVLAASLFHHSDAGLPAGLERALGRVVVTPALHWVHHHALRADTDSNYGTIFASGTRCSPRAARPGAGAACRSA